MTNKITYVSVDKMKEIKLELQNNVLVVEIEGKKCSNLTDYLCLMSNLFCFPTKSSGLDSYNDWMTDLSWLNSNEIVIIVYDHSEFLNQDLYSKKCIIENFEEVILPWWESEVVNYVVEGKTKKVMVYLVD